MGRRERSEGRRQTDRALRRQVPEDVAARFERGDLLHGMPDERNRHSAGEPVSGVSAIERRDGSQHGSMEIVRATRLFRSDRLVVLHPPAAPGNAGGAWDNGFMSETGAQLSASQRPKWFHLTTGVTLIVVAVVLTIAWHVVGVTWSEHMTGASTARWVVYFLGSLMFGLLLAGLVLVVILLLREVRLNERQSNFISAVTHELKTPVASLKLYLDTLQMRDLPESRREEFYRTMRQDLDRLNATINSVLGAARYTDRPVVDPQPVDLAQLARHSIELTRTRNQLACETIRYDGPDGLFVTGDAAALETAVLNLLDNAVKYSKENTQVDVLVSLTRDPDGSAQLRVKDHGIGIGRGHLRFIFHRFYRIGSEARRVRTGTGLGLFIVRSVVKGHKGTVTADSAGADRGSTFTITLPGASLVEPDTQPDEIVQHG
jgi:signal transduction histidine kinase